MSTQQRIVVAIIKIHNSPTRLSRLCKPTKRVVSVQRARLRNERKLEIETEKLAEKAVSAANEGSRNLARYERA